MVGRDGVSQFVMMQCCVVCDMCTVIGVFMRQSSDMSGKLSACYFFYLLLLFLLQIFMILAVESDEGKAL